MEYPENSTIYFNPKFVKDISSTNVRKVLGDPKLKEKEKERKLLKFIPRSVYDYLKEFEVF